MGLWVRTETKFICFLPIVLLTVRPAPASRAANESHALDLTFGILNRFIT
jgi:hypothetical protein